MRKFHNSLYVIFALISAIMLTVVVQSCESESDSAYATMKAKNPQLRKVVVADVVQTSSYTYLQLKEEQDSYWAAISRREDISKGGTYYYDNFMEMKNFHSKELDRDFESVYFIEVFDDKPFAGASNMTVENTTGAPKIADQEIEGIEPVEGGVTLAELFDHRDTYDGTQVKVKGIVVKYSPAIMNKNWVHIQDGTQNKDNFDLTITTNAECNPGDMVVFEGTIKLNQDFGYGYAYDVLMEDASLLEVEKATTLQ